MAKHAPNPVHEVQDMEKHWVFFEHLFEEAVAWEMPTVYIPGYGPFQITKFMLLEVIAAGIILAIFIPLARRIRTGELPRGRFWNLFEWMLLFVRDQIARPNLDSHHAAHAHGTHADEPGHGHHQVELHEADKYVPFLWTLFLFVLCCNLLGMIPLMGSPTASIWVTGGMALISFLMLHGCVIAKYGVARYFQSLWPKIDMPPGTGFKVMGYGLTLMIGTIELIGTFIKSGVLAVRLFANMFAGHMVLANILFFIYLAGTAAGTGLLWGGVTFASVTGVVLLSLLELFVGFLQAYIFTFLTALFMGMQLHHAEGH
jgi:F-type H+-transporting ATPase subunit a